MTDRDGAYRSDLEAAQARIAKLEADLDERNSDPAGARRRALVRERDVLAALAQSGLIRSRLVLGQATTAILAVLALLFALAQIWIAAALGMSAALLAHAIFTQSARARRAYYAKRLAGVEEQIAALDVRTGAP
jgi:hypothetical protein